MVHLCPLLHLVVKELAQILTPSSALAGAPVTRFLAHIPSQILDIWLTRVLAIRKNHTLSQHAHRPSKLHRLERVVPERVVFSNQFVFRCFLFQARFMYSIFCSTKLPRQRMCTRRSTIPSWVTYDTQTRSSGWKSTSRVRSADRIFVLGLSPLHHPFEALPPEPAAPLEATNFTPWHYSTDLRRHNIRHFQRLERK